MLHISLLQLKNVPIVGELFLVIKHGRSAAHAAFRPSAWLTVWHVMRPARTSGRVGSCSNSAAGTTGVAAAGHPRDYEAERGEVVPKIVADRNLKKGGVYVTKKIIRHCDCGCFPKNRVQYVVQGATWKRENYMAQRGS